MVGNLPGPCNPAGLAFGPDGRLYVADSDRIMVLKPDAAAPPTATVYASGDRRAPTASRSTAAATSGSPTAGPRRAACGGSGATRRHVEVFRVQPLANDVVPGGVGRDVRGLPPGTITITETGRQASNTLGSQHLVANGLAFGRDGTLYVADTARGAIWRVYLDHRGGVRSPTGCDTTFTANTLCLDDIFVQHPYLDGADGIVIDDDDTIFVAANERNAVTVVTEQGPTSSSTSATPRRRPGCATRARSSSRRARCSSATGCA